GRELGGARALPLSRQPDLGRHRHLERARLEQRRLPLREAGAVSRRAVIALAALALVGCSDDLPPIGQVRLAIDTDAPLPPPPGEVLGPAEPAPLFDSLRVDVYPPGASEPCAGCSRTFGLD